jgi:hypothetical protein
MLDHTCSSIGTGIEVAGVEGCSNSDKRLCTLVDIAESRAVVVVGWNWEAEWDLEVALVGDWD